MKKHLSIMLTAIMVASIMVGCGSSSDTTNNNSTNTTSTPTVDTAPVQVEEDQDEVIEALPVPVNVMISADSAYMGLASFDEKVTNGTIYVNEYNVTIEDSVDTIVESILAGDEVDIATIPLELAAKLYNSSELESKLNVLAIINMGGVYLVENGNSVTDMKGLSDKTIYALGEYSSYETQIKYILSENDVDTTGITFEYVESYDEAFEIDGAVVVLPEPYVTAGLTEYENVNICLDLASEWDKIQMEGDVPAPFITSVLVSNTDFMEERPNIIREFLMYANMSINALNIGVGEGNNPLEQQGISLEAIENTSIMYIPQEDLAFFGGAYLYVLEEYDSGIFGGEISTDDFFYYDEKI